MKKLIGKFQKIFYVLKKGIYFAWNRHHFLIPPKTLVKYIKSAMIVIKRGATSNLFINQKAYLKWIEENEKDFERKTFKYNPLISIVIPVYNVSEKLLAECLDSILDQTYNNFEICLADDCSTNEETIYTLKKYENNPKIKITYRKKNGHISEASNTAINMAKGEFIVLVDNDDTISKDALYYFVEVLNNDKTIDMIYSDEDKLDFKGLRCEPHFKPDYSPDTLMSVNYICHLTMIRKSIIEKIGGFRSEYNGSQDYDLFLRVVEQTNKIFHIEKILYHWRMSATSTAGYLGNKDYTKDKAILALNDSLKRRNIKGKVVPSDRVSAYITHYEHNNPLVSIIIPIKDKSSLLKTCVDSIYEKTNYKNYEIILIDNNSTEQTTFDLLNKYKIEHDNFKVLRLECEFNYSFINNEGVKRANGEYVVFLNNDTEIIDNNWLDEMVGYGMQDHVGCVGIKLLYKDNKVQHAGVVLGYGGLAGHIYVTADKNDNGLFGRLAIPYDYTAVTAACLLIKKSKFLEVNGFDENLKVALNDVDLNIKLLDKGYYNVMLPNVTMYHYESKSRGYEVTEEKRLRFQKEQEYLKNKWGNKIEKDRFYSKFNF